MYPASTSGLQRRSAIRNRPAPPALRSAGAKDFPILQNCNCFSLVSESSTRLFEARKLRHAPGMRQEPFRYLAAALALAIAPAHAQVRRQPAQPETMPLEAALNVGGKKVEFRGQGQCKAAPQASIYDIPAALYSVSQSSGSQSLNLTLWQPTSGAANMMSLHISTGSTRYEVDCQTARTYSLMSPRVSLRSWAIRMRSSPR